MSTTNVIGIVFAALFSGILAWSVRDSHSKDSGNREGLRYTSFLGGLNLPVLLIILLAASSFYYSLAESMFLVASSFFGVFLHICFYNMLLLLLLPLFRRHISARSCACLWMLPNILYFSQVGFMSKTRPIWIISLPGSLLKILTIIWLAGFAAVFLYKLFEHIIFRYQIMRKTVPVRDEKVLDLWKQEQTNAGFAKQDYKLLYSPNVKTPLSVGLFKLTTRVILPPADYSQEELRMIFRHELIHICRSDAWSKFSLIFCTAVCWFNPFMWISMRKSFDDLELSCDETVLIDADDAQRHQYAQLLLKTAGQEQGFTTCLSASASAMRYRLKNTVKPRKLHSGALTVGLISFLLLLTCGSVALAYETGIGKEAIFFGQDPEACTLSSVRDADYSVHRDYICISPSELKEYLCDLPIQKLTGNYDFSEPSRSLVLLYDTPNGMLGIDLNKDTIGLTKFWGKEISQERLYVPGGLDWDYLDELIPKMPGVEIQLMGPRDMDYGYASVDTVTQIFEDRSEIIKGPLESDDSCAGIYGNIEFRTMMLNFQESPISPVEVTISSWDWSTSETMTLNTPDQVIQLPSNTVHLKISASFDGPEKSVYETVFRYDIQSDNDN